MIENIKYCNKCTQLTDTNRNICNKCSNEARRLNKIAKGLPVRKKILVTEVGKECTKCGDFKLFEKYHDNPAAKTKKASQCKQCTEDGVLERILDDDKPIKSLKYGVYKNLEKAFPDRY